MCGQSMEKMGFRHAKYGDRELLFRWANDREVRRQSFHSEQISRWEHIRWFEEKLHSEDCDLLIWVEDGVDKGMLRLDYREGKAYVNYSVAKNWRGKGTASRLIGALPAYVRVAAPEIHTLVAEVKAENGFSRRVFEKCGYSQEQKAGRIEFTLAVKP